MTNQSNNPTHINERFVLTLDDDEDFNNLLKVVFKKHGFKIITTCTCQDFISQLKINPPSVCLIDINLEQGQGVGFSLLEAIRKKYDLSIPIIMLSYRREDKDIIRALELGANDYITKPLDDGLLIDKINQYLKDENIKPLPFYRVSENDENCTIMWDNHIKTINEFGVTLHGPNLMAKGTLIKLTGDFIKEISGNINGIKVSVNHSWIDEADHLYQAQREFDYEDENLLEHIRGYLLNHQR